MIMTEHDLDSVARNIVNQLADLWNADVNTRQATNDTADDFVHQVIWDRIYR